MFKKILLLSLALGSHWFASAQSATEPDSLLRSVTLSPTTIAANRVAENRREVAQVVQTIESRRIAQLNPQTSADLVASMGNIHVQRSQQGGGSPVLRGFEASRVLLVVDGVRMNNIMYRTGHLQNIITVDPAMLERVEVLMGPASTVYGSDALGGAVVFTTRNPTLSDDGSLAVRTNAFLRYGSANQERTGHLDFSLGGRRFGSITSLSFSDFGDLRMGANNGFYRAWGRRPYYAERFGDRDSLVRNDNPLVQRQSGYTQYDVLQKFLYRAGRATHTLGLQYSTSSDIPRYDRLTDPGPGGLRFAEWYYGPQVRGMAKYDLDMETREGSWLDRIHAGVSAQQIVESRHQRRFGNNNRFDRVEEATVVGYTIDFQRDRGDHSLRFGIDGQSNLLNSTAERVNIVTNETAAADTRYPDGDNSMHSAAAYVTHRWRLSDRWVLNDGARVGYTTLRSTFVSKEFFAFPFDEASQNTPTWSGHLGLVYTPTEDWRLSGVVSTGFRVPNVDDMAKVFESTQDRLIVPNPDLKPETTANFELSLTRSWGAGTEWESTVFVTSFRDAIVTDQFTFNGASQLEYNGELADVYASQNKQQARIWGWSTRFLAAVYEDLSLYGSAAYTQGTVLAEGDDDDFPLDHIPPLVGRVGFEYHSNRVRVEGFGQWNGWKRAADYSPTGEDNLQYATPDGMPAWMTLNLHGGYRIVRGLQLQLGVDNILDTQYRTFASGIHAPGRNVFVALRWQG
jgi:hemoglobin/transferrin/lactoferrin receptor protein